MAGYLKEGKKYYRVTYLCAGVNPNDLYFKEHHYKFLEKEELDDYIDNLKKKAMNVIYDSNWYNNTTKKITQMYIDNSYNETNPVLIVTVIVNGYF